MKHRGWNFNVCLKTDETGNYRELKYNIRMKHRGRDLNVCLKTDETQLLELKRIKV